MLLRVDSVNHDYIQKINEAKIKLLAVHTKKDAQSSKNDRVQIINHKEIEKVSKFLHQGIVP